MPMLDIYIPEGALEQESEHSLLAELTDILLAEEGVDPSNESGRGLAWVFLHRPAEVWVGGSPTEEPRYKVIASVPEGQYVDERRERMVARVTAAIAAAEAPGRSAAAERTWVFAREVPEATWGAGGRIYRLADIGEHVLGDKEIAVEYARRALATTRAERATRVDPDARPFDRLPTTVIDAS